jgi:hypothetical protein
MRRPAVFGFADGRIEGAEPILPAMVLLLTMLLIILGHCFGIRNWSVTNGRTVVRKEKRLEAKSFIQRHGDQIILALLNASIGAAIGAWMARHL